MAAVPTVILVGATPEGEARLRETLADLGPLRTVGPDLRTALELVRQSLPCVAVLALGPAPDGALSLCRQLARVKGCSAMVVGEERDVDTVLRAMRAGAKEFALLEPGGTEVRRAVQGLCDQWLARKPTAEMRVALGLGAVVALLGAKGGAGSTTLAINLAGALRASSENAAASVVVLDLDLQMGDVLAFLDLPSPSPLGDLLDESQRPNRPSLLRAIPAHRSGIFALGRADEGAPLRSPEPAELGELLRLLQQHFDYVIVDGLRDLGEHALAALDSATAILPVLTPDMPALKSAARCLGALRQLGYPDDRIKVVVNRFQAGGAVDERGVGQALGHAVDATVSNDFTTVIRAINGGQLLISEAPEAAVTRDVQRLADLVARSRLAGAAPPRTRTRPPAEA